MKKSIITIIVALYCLMAIGPAATAQEAPATASDTLVVLWTSADVELAEKMVFMYTHNAKKAGWFKEVILIVWGPSEKLLAENETMQQRVKAMQDDGIIVEACVACARMYGVADELKVCEVDVKGMGTPLTKYLKRGYRVLSL